MMKVAVSPIVALVLLLTAGIATADHYLYLAEDPARQAPGPLTENDVFFRWGLSTGPLLWWAEPSLHSEVTTAINNWRSAVPQLAWSESSTEADADVVFKSDSCDGLPAKACFIATEWFADPIRDASYWKKGVVFINPNVNWGPGGRLGAIAHEIGHIYGLHERYPEDGQRCNNHEVTIMDMLKEVNGQWFHCDGLQGPSLIDKVRVTAYWSQGKLSSFTATAEGSAGKYTWKSDAWAEYRHQLKWYYWDGSEWVQYHSKHRATGVGIHSITERATASGDRTLTEVVDRNTYEAPAGWHMACGDPWFIQWDTAGIWNCSNMVWLD